MKLFVIIQTLEKHAEAAQYLSHFIAFHTAHKKNKSIVWKYHNKINRKCVFYSNYTHNEYNSKEGFFETIFFCEWKGYSIGF